MLMLTTARWAGVDEASTSGSRGEADTAAAMLLEKHAKSRLAVAADHFNLDYKKGFQFLQVCCCVITGPLVNHVTEMQKRYAVILQQEVLLFTT